MFCIRSHLAASRRGTAPPSSLHLSSLLAGGREGINRVIFAFGLSQRLRFSVDYGSTKCALISDRDALENRRRFGRDSAAIFCGCVPLPNSERCRESQGSTESDPVAPAEEECDETAARVRPIEGWFFRNFWIDRKTGGGGYFTVLLTTSILRELIYPFALCVSTLSRLRLT